MVKLIALSACAAIAPKTIGDVTLAEVVVDRLTSVAPFTGQNKAVAAALKAQVEGSLAVPNRRSGPVTWFGHGVWMVAGDVTLDGIAAVTDQTDAWAVVSLAGKGAEDVLARLVPVDLRASVFGKNHVAKTMLGHMSVTITRTQSQTFEIMGMRSMAQTLVHELEVAMQGVAAR